MIVWGSEFGRTPLGENRGGNPNATGRDHHPFAFTMLAAGGGIKGGQIYGETDEIGWSISARSRRSARFPRHDAEPVRL
jgi:uncharacterized protein (DUF1501 family)